MATKLARATLRNVSRSPGAEDDLHVRSSAGLLESRDFVVERLPASAENMAAGDDDVDFVRPRFHRPANFGDAFRERREPGGKSGGDRRDVNAASFQAHAARFR